MTRIAVDHPRALRATALALLVAAAACLNRGLAAGGPAESAALRVTTGPAALVAGAGRDDGRGEIPRRVVARAIGVRAPVVAVAPVRTVLEAPSRSRVGWWMATDDGVPAGPQVLVGHTAAAGGGVFDRLGRLRPGESVSLVTDSGVRRYRVTRVRVVTVEAFPRRAGVLTDPAATGDLVLVTCSDWDGSRFRSTTVVTAVPDRAEDAA